MHSQQFYDEIGGIATAIGNELKRLGRWQDEELPADRFEDMGAFGSNTMTFEQWIQFVLLRRIESIIREKDSFPESSMTGVYANRYFGGDHEALALQRLLGELDAAIEGRTPQSGAGSPTALTNSVMIGDTEIPPVLAEVIRTLSQFKGDDLESQLQTVDVFLQILSASVKDEIINLVMGAAERHGDAGAADRLKKACQTIRIHGRCTTPYDHDHAMDEYIRNHRKNYPDDTKPV